MLTPTIEKLAAEFAGNLKVGKMNTDENQLIPSGLAPPISAIPTVLFFKDGVEVLRLRLVGVNTESKFKANLSELGVVPAAQ